MVGCSRARVPMVATVKQPGHVNLREVLDTTESDVSETADQIRSFHSVMVVPDSRAGRALFCHIASSTLTLTEMEVH